MQAEHRELTAGQSGKKETLQEEKTLRFVEKYGTFLVYFHSISLYVICIFLVYLAYGKKSASLVVLSRRWYIFRPTQIRFTPLLTYAKSALLHI